jgi:glycosyltransferase involved in cell wall biosynthesis
MKILYVVPYVPNLIRVRPYNLIRHLAQRGHAITVAAIWTNLQERAALERLRSDGCQIIDHYVPGWRSLWNCVRALPSKTPLQAVYSWDASLARRVAELARPNGHPAFDVMHVEHLRGAQYGLFLKTRFHKLPVIWDSVDSISLLFRQAMMRSKSTFSRGLTRFELGRTERYEGWLLSQFERVVVTSPKDLQALLALLPSEQAQPAIDVLSNGVDLDYFKPDEGIAREPATVVASGKMSYHANIAMALRLVQEIMPSVWARQPEVKVWIVGKDPPRSIQNLAQHPNITVTGTVDDLRPYLRKATLAVTPVSYSAGIQNKVLEAMACGTPVISSPQAVSALSPLPEKDFLIAQTDAEFSESILRLLDSPALRREMMIAGRRYVEKKHDWAVIAGQLEKYYQEMMRN